MLAKEPLNQNSSFELSIQHFASTKGLNGDLNQPSRLPPDIKLAVDSSRKLNSSSNQAVSN